jgi:hypothetical protein
MINNKTDTETVHELEIKLKNLEDYHKLCLSLNRVKRKDIEYNTKISEAEKITNDSNILKKFLWNLDNGGRFDTTKSNNKIKALKIEINKKRFPRKNITKEYKTFTLVTNYEIDRYQVFFSDTPPLEHREFLKSIGYRWNGKNKAWQQYLTFNGELKTNELLNFLNTEL